LLVSFLYFLFLSIDLPARKICEIEIEKIRMKKEPLLIEEFLPERNIDENLYRKVKDILNEFEKKWHKNYSSEIEKSFSEKGYDVKFLDELKKKKILQKYEKFIPDVKFILENYKPAGNRDCIIQYMKLFGFLSEISTIIRLKCGIDAIERNKEKLKEDFLLLFEISKFMEKPVYLNSFFTLLDEYHSNFKCVLSVYSILKQDKEILKIIEENLPDFNEEVFKFAIMGERVILYQTFKGFSEGKNGLLYFDPFLYEYPDPTENFLRFPLRIFLKPFIRNITGLYLHLLNMMIEIPEVSPENRKSFLKKIDEEINNLPKYHYLITGSIILKTDFFIDVIKCKVYRNLLLTFSGIEKYKIHKNKFPNSLEEIFPEFCKNKPFDPFNEKMLNYKKEKDGYKIWSVGPNGIDEGGIKLTCAEKRKVGYKLNEKDDIFIYVHSSGKVEF
jgi:hypothetical protein